MEKLFGCFSEPSVRLRAQPAILHYRVPKPDGISGKSGELAFELKRIDDFIQNGASLNTSIDNWREMPSRFA